MSDPQPEVAQCSVLTFLTWFEPFPGLKNGKPIDSMAIWDISLVVNYYAFRQYN